MVIERMHAIVNQTRQYPNDRLEEDEKLDITPRAHSKMRVKEIKEIKEIKIKY